jgi:AbrB family looped-hinge helix DNA binding protein
MVNISITRMSSKGQVVIPQDMRKGMKEGEKILIIQGDGQLILKKASDVDENFKEDLEFARRTEEAWKEIEKGNFIEVDLENLEEEMAKW